MIKYNFENNTIKKVTVLPPDAQLHNFGNEMTLDWDHDYYYILNDPKKQKYILVMSDDKYVSSHGSLYKWLYASSTKNELLKKLENEIRITLIWNIDDPSDDNIKKIKESLKIKNTIFIKTKTGEIHYHIFKI
jgi:hypothetical protein